MDAGITGLRNHQVRMDVIGNNIANVNTVGFKTGRVTFEESFAQLLRGASRPPGDLGGTNPLQVGLGMAVGSIDTIVTQGNLESTGQITDLAIEGKAFFVVSNGEGNFYTRNGGFQFDSRGRVVLPTNGMILQGKIADTSGNFPVGTPVGDITIPFSSQTPAKDTEEVKYSGNLDSDSGALGTVLYTQKYLAQASGAETLTSISNSKGQELGMRAGDIITISGENSLGQMQDGSFTVVDDPGVLPPPDPITNTGQVHTLNDLVGAINTFIGDDPILSGEPITASVNISVPPTGKIDITYGAGVDRLQNFRIVTNRPISTSFVTNAFSFDARINPTETSSSDKLLRPAIATDMLLDALAAPTLYDSNGNLIDIAANDVIAINGAVGGTNYAGTLTVVAGTTMQELLDQIQTTFRLPKNDGTLQNNLSVSLNLGDTRDDNIPDGAIAIRGQKETAFALSNVSIIATNADPTTLEPVRFNGNNGFTELQRARATGQYDTSIEVYDESGAAHTLTTTFTATNTPGHWNWEVNTNSGETITAGRTGKLVFAREGTPQAFTFDDGGTYFQFSPNNGANEVRIRLNVGSPGNFEGITSARAPTTASATEQDGYPPGRLDEISIDEFGKITGAYTNGIHKNIAQIMVADFRNAGGLLKKGDSVFAESPNSGAGIMGIAGISSSSVIKPGALEISNVELATEFTSMISTQRGYQANARVITTSDQMLQELVQLVR
jgi:flagellar hook protein FlgE